jgi:methylglutaconyl-CoA hydratase
MSEMLRIEMDGPVAHLILNRPDKRNALSAELVDQMVQGMLSLNANDAIRVVVIRSADKPFCAGADLGYLTQLRSNTLEENEADSQRLRQLFDAIYLSPKYIISQVEGPALAGGCGLATLADCCVATPEATFGYTEVKIGFIPALVMVYLREKVSGAVMSDILLSGRVFDAAEAQSMQLVQHVVPADQVSEFVIHHANQICNTTSPQAVAKVKEMMRTISAMNRDQALDYAAKQNAVARGSEDCKKGIDAFLNKQPIQWR